MNRDRDQAKADAKEAKRRQNYEDLQRLRRLDDRRLQAKADAKREAKKQERKS